MEIAVLVDCDNRAEATERDFRSITRLEFLAENTFISNRGNPLDVVFPSHGMGDGTDFHRQLVTILGDEGDVFLLGSIRSVGFQLDHGLSTADQGSAAVIDQFNDISAFLASEKSCLHVAMPPTW